MEAFSAKVEDFQIDITQRINDKILDLSSQGDEIQDQIDEKFKIGEELTYEQMTQISVDGRRRYEEKYHQDTWIRKIRQVCKSMEICLSGWKF